MEQSKIEEEKRQRMKSACMQTSVQKQESLGVQTSQEERKSFGMQTSEEAEEEKESERSLPHVNLFQQKSDFSLLRNKEMQGSDFKTSRDKEEYKKQIQTVLPKEERTFPSLSGSEPFSSSSAPGESEDSLYQ